ERGARVADGAHAGRRAARELAGVAPDLVGIRDHHAHELEPAIRAHRADRRPADVARAPDDDSAPRHRRPISARRQAEGIAARGLAGARAREQLVFARHAPPQLGHHLAREQPLALLRDLVGHAAEAEYACEGLAARALDRVDDLLVALLGRAPGLEPEEELDRLVDAAGLADPLLRRLVGLVAAQLGQMVADQLVVADH